MNGMEKEGILKLQANIWKMLSNTTRLKILEELCDGEKTVGELVSAIEIR